MTRRALVTGGAGFIGSHVADRFLAEGFEVEVLDDLSTGRRSNLPAGARFHELSVTDDAAARVVREGRFDVIAHVAAQMDVRRSVAEPVFDAQTNIIGTIRLAEAVTQSGFPTRMVFTSTGGALYGDFNEPPNAETFAKDPESPYGIAKLSAEYYLSYFGRVHGLEYIALRFGNVYGPRQDLHGEAGTIAIFCARILEGRPLTIHGDGRQTRDFLYVSDVVDAAFLAASAPVPPAARIDARAFNIGTGVATSINELVEMLKEITGAAPAVEHAPRRAGEDRHSSLDASRAREVLGWSPQVDLRQGLALTYEWAAAASEAQPA